MTTKPWSSTTHASPWRRIHLLAAHAEPRSSSWVRITGRIPVRRCNQSTFQESGKNTETSSRAMSASRCSPDQDELDEAGRRHVDKACVLCGSARCRVRLSHVCIDHMMLAGFTCLAVGDAADASSLTLDVQVNLNRCVGPEWRLIDQIDEHFPRAQVVDINAPFLPARSIALSTGSGNTHELHVLCVDLLAMGLRLDAPGLGGRPGRAALRWARRGFLRAHKISSRPRRSRSSASRHNSAGKKPGENAIVTSSRRWPSA